ncbi:hypothetical protein FVE85_4596 [Porphyridium purpureum]|uniref:Uncharacterized protein n=1 Tax=Porphyridium purpureum TaxID=35688 RepID=A0A5J4YFZ4_PORPP|nr:hypothetical protein FVE85_4596 [Porphyridium purpureum]|eukprot:POR2897..scf252_32
MRRALGLGQRCARTLRAAASRHLVSPERSAHLRRKSLDALRYQLVSEFDNPLQLKRHSCRWHGFGLHGFRLHGFGLHGFGLHGFGLHGFGLHGQREEGVGEESCGSSMSSARALPEIATETGERDATDNKDSNPDVAHPGRTEACKMKPVPRGCSNLRVFPFAFFSKLRRLIRSNPWMTLRTADPRNVERWAALEPSCVLMSLRSMK